MQDVQHIEYLLKTKFGFQDVVVLRDNQPDRSQWPTKRNILQGIDRLVHGAQAGDSLFFHFSGVPHPSHTRTCFSSAPALIVKRFLQKHHISKAVFAR